MRTPFKGPERTAAQETGEQENLQKATLMEPNEAKTETEKVEVPENSEIQGNKAGVTDVDDNIVDDDGNDLTEGKSLPPNKTFVLDGIEYKTDDNGNIYVIDGKRQPDTTYKLNGNVYTTDKIGRIILCDGRPVLSPENPRDNDAQRQAGDKDRRPNDQGGHIIGRDMNGDGGIGNLVAMDSKINQSDYKRMENDIKAALGEGKDVTTKTKMAYSGDSERPDRITVTVTVDGKETVYEYDNNLDGLLDKEVSGKSPTAKELLDEHPDAHVSSVKREYDENEALLKTTAYITWTDEDGNNIRKPIIVPND